MITIDERAPLDPHLDYPAIRPRATCRRRSFTEMRRDQRRDLIRRPESVPATAPMPREVMVAIAREVAARGWFMWELEAILGDLPDAVRAWFERQTAS